jgi:hypothetical protein
MYQNCRARVFCPVSVVINLQAKKFIGLYWSFFLYTFHYNQYLKHIVGNYFLYILLYLFI